MLLDEVTDQVVYAQTLHAQIAEAVSTLQNAIASQDWNEAAKVLAILTGQLRPPVD